MNATMMVSQGMALKARREQESKIHSQLHSNLHALTLLFPPSDDFRRVFTKDMFVKNNKAAFQQVVYYLLNVLEPDVVKIKIPSWPIFSPKHEAQFRGEVMKYVNELNGLYEFANVPLIMTSHLISPGGFKFAKFVLKLSQLVMSVVLQRDLRVKISFLYAIRPNRSVVVAKNALGRLKEKIRQIERETVEVYAKSEESVNFAHCEAKMIAEEKKVIREKLKQAKSNNTAELCIYSTDFINLDEKTKEKLAYSLRIHSKCLQIQELTSYLFTNEITIKSNKNLPENILRTTITNDSSKINLNEFFTTLATFLASLRLQKPSFSTYYLDTTLEISCKTNTWLLMMCKVLEELKERQVKLSAIVENALVFQKSSSISVKIDVVDGNEVLAVPLEDSSPRKFVM